MSKLTTREWSTLSRLLKSASREYPGLRTFSISEKIAHIIAGLRQVETDYARVRELTRKEKPNAGTSHL